MNAISYILPELALEHRENFDSFITGFLTSEGEYGFNGEYNPQVSFTIHRLANLSADIHPMDPAKFSPRGMQSELWGTDQSFSNMLTKIAETCTGSYKLPEYFSNHIVREDTERWKESLETTILFQFREGMERKQFQTSIELKGFEFEDSGLFCFTKECDRDRVDPFSTAIAHLMLGSGDDIVFDYLGEGQLSLGVESIELPASIDMLVLSRAIELSRPDFVLILPYF